MERALRILRFAPFALLVACTAPTDSVPTDPSASGKGTLFGATSSTKSPGGTQSGQTSTTTTTPGATTPGAAPATDAPLTEVVNVFIDGGGLCTGTLISKTVAVTAGHCVDQSQFQTWQVEASLSAKQTSNASRVVMFDSNYEDVAHPDIGAIILDTPIVLSAYAELTDISAQVESQTFSGVAMVRAFIDTEAPFKLVPDLQISSGVPFGYEHGLVTRYFSEGGDSGAGLFLVENGKRTNKLVGVARQPEPSTDRDHFTRIDAAVIAWLKSLGG